jgi:hypothetical protein
MRQTLPLLSLRHCSPPLSSATVVDVVAAGVKTVAAESAYSAASASGIKLAVPSSLSNFPNELLPQ